MTKQKHIAVLMGGMSKEREVSLTTGNNVTKAIKEIGYRVTQIDVGKNLVNDLERIKPDIAFNALHGTFGEDGCIQGLLEILQIPYTHSGVSACAIAMNKQNSKYIFNKAGILCPPGKIVKTKDILEKDLMPRPYVAKPIDQGSSVGVVIVDEQNIIDPKELIDCQEYLLEKYIPGKELSVAVLDNKALGVIELRPKAGFYDYINKYTENKTEHIFPAAINDNVYNNAMKIAVKAHKILNCKGITRCDFRYDDSNEDKLYLLELNTHPGMTPLSLAPELAKHRGIEYNDLVRRLIDDAGLEKWA